ncbi:MAG TPA: hypothetical protein PKZ32_07630 [Candidatus Melainabacteria bacterium]|nr:hypothetical protein [Candidatus Melainabacteria bacterium]
MKDLFKDRKSERIGLLLATLLFGIIGIGQLWRAFSGVSVALNGANIPVWVSLVFGCLALFMSFWMGQILRHNRPLI